MGALFSTCAVMGTWCFCASVASLFSACCGNDKASTVTPGATSGRRRSVLLLVMSVAIAFGFQYGVAPELHNSTVAPSYLVDAWSSGCEDYATDELRERCAGHAGAYRAAGAATLFFLAAAIAAACKPSANREAWPAKYFLFLVACAATIFIPNDPLFSNIYLHIAMIGGILFVLFQQLILIDLAYNWNESWVAKADALEEAESGTGRKWLGALLACCLFLLIGSIVAWVIMYVYFTGCPDNEAFIIITVLMSVLVTVAQLSGEEASLLTTCIIIAYATYLCFTAVSKNPDGECNPKLGEENVAGIVLGIGFTFLSLAWTGWSFTAESRVQGRGSRGPVSLHESNAGASEENRVTGVVINSTNHQSTQNDTEADGSELPADADTDAEEENVNSNSFGNSWKLNVILALICCFYAMALTNWGSIDSGADSANPDTGKATMWMVIAGEWVVLTLYLWTLVAPRLFPDRDFS